MSVSCLLCPHRICSSPPDDGEQYGSASGKKPHGLLPGVSTAFNSRAAPPVLRAGQARCLIVYRNSVIAKARAIAPPCRWRSRSAQGICPECHGARCMTLNCSAGSPYCWYELFKVPWSGGRSFRKRNGPGSGSFRPDPRRAVQLPIA